MKRRSISLLGAIALVGLGACASAGNSALRDETRESVSQKLAEGQTMDEVRAVFGDPSSTTYTDGGQEIWKYEFTEAQAKASNFVPVVSLFNSGMVGTKKELTILFDENNVVSKFNMNESAVDTKTGIIR